jgi:hypothetical protein
MGVNFYASRPTITCSDDLVLPGQGIHEQSDYADRDDNTTQVNTADFVDFRIWGSLQVLVSSVRNHTEIGPTSFQEFFRLRCVSGGSSSSFTRRQYCRIETNNYTSVLNDSRFYCKTHNATLSIWTHT